MEECIGISVTGVIGMDMDRQSFHEAFEKNEIDFIGCDAGSSDGGPYYLGASASMLSSYVIEKELEILLLKAREHNIPLLLGSATTGGNREQLKIQENQVRAIARKHNLHFRMALIDSELDPDFLKEKLARGQIRPFDDGVHLPALTEKDIDSSNHIVAQIGAAPFVKALNEKADVILAGRACDDAIFAAVPISKGYDLALSLHMGKILECAAASAEVRSEGIPGRSALLGKIRKDHFLVVPTNEGWASTVSSVASHDFFERINPIFQPNAEGMVDLSSTQYEQIDPRTVKISGTKIIEGNNTFKLEGTTPVGYRSICLGAIRNPNVIERIDTLIAGVRKRNEDNFGDQDYILDIKRFGMDACLGELEPVKTLPHEVGILIDVVAPTQEIATAVCGLTRSNMTEGKFKGQKGHGGNMALPVVPFVIEMGLTYKYSVWHLMDIDDLCEGIKNTYHEV